MRAAQRTRLGVLLVALGLVLAACGGGGGGEEPSGGGAEASKVGMIFDVGGKGDGTFNDAAFEGLTAAKNELGDQITTIDQSPNAEGSNRRELVDGLISDEYGLIIGVGFAFSEDIARAAAENPEVSFAVVDGFGCDPANMRCLGFKEHEGSFLMGAAAALKTTSNTVGFIGGQEGDLIKKFQAGYEAGVEYINQQEGKQVEVLVDYIGSTVQAFNDTQRAGELANKQLGQGADVLYHAAGLAGSSVIKAAADAQKYAIGVDSDQSLTTEDPEQKKWILTSMLKRVDNSVKKSITDYVNGSFSGGFESLGLKEGGVDYAKNEFNTELLGDIPTTLDDLKAKIISGEITVPETPAA